MRNLTVLFCAALAAGLALLAVPVRADPIPEDILARMRAADVVLLGEVHDNPAHHARQVAAVIALQPGAMVWEMLTAETAARIDAGKLGQPGHLEQVLASAEAGWPGFKIYVPIMQATRNVPVFGGLVPHRAVEAVMDQGIAAVFGAEAAKYGLTIPLASEDRAPRLAEQAEAHCNAIPSEQLPMMVSFQRLRDAVLARAAANAYDETGGPVIVITGNGHARKDVGVPEVLGRVRPGLRVFALGQSEDGAITGSFDAVLDSPAVDRPDPCAAFANPPASAD